MKRIDHGPNVATRTLTPKVPRPKRIDLILKDLSDVRRDKVYFRNPMDVTSNGQVINRGFIALSGVVNQTEKDCNRVFTV
jgi:hypothetical protein